MSRRTERVARLVQQTIGEIILRRISDPRIDPARVSVTRVEVSEDTARAKVFCSTIGTEAEQRTALRALQHAAGRIQEMMAKQITLRNMPVLQFVADEQFKKTLTTLALIQGAMDEIRQQEQEQEQAAGSDADDAPIESDDSQ